MKKKQNGSLTIECSLIFPIILAVIITLVWMLIFLYDRAIVQTAAIHGALECDYSRDVNKKLEQKIEDDINSQLAGRLVGVEKVSVHVEVNSDRCQINIGVYMNAVNGFGGKFDFFETNIKKERMSGTQTIRKIRQVLKISEILENAVKESENENKKESE